jgi:hypothetical protein
LLDGATLELSPIAFPVNDTSHMPADPSAYRPLASAPLDQNPPAEYEPFSN